jgi:hypothetical protein
MIHWLLVLLAVILEAIVLLALAVPFALPRLEAWQAAAFVAFFLSVLVGGWPWAART